MKRTPALVKTLLVEGSPADVEVRDLLPTYELAANSLLTTPVGIGQFMQVVQPIDDFWLSQPRLPQ